MPVVDLREFEEEFVIHFGTEAPRINAYTLASTLVALADAAKEANQLVNPGYSIEVVVEALGPGSFRAKIKAVYSGAGNLFSKENLKTIALNILASYIFVNTLSPDAEVVIKVDEGTVVVQQGDRTVVIPQATHEAMKQVQKSTKFREDVGRAFNALERDPGMNSLRLENNTGEDSPPFEIPRENFALISAEVGLDAREREVEEIAEVSISRAILERSRRRWEFVWRGIKISAPVLDEKFFDDFFAHRITIAPGDRLKIRLRILQQRDDDTGIYTNERYEVIEVLEHLPKLKQLGIPE